MRYAITGATPQQVVALGGSDVKGTRRIGVVFATFPEAKVKKLLELGYSVESIDKVNATVEPPSPVQAIPTYSAEQLAFVAGVDEISKLFDPPLHGEGINIAIIDSGIRESHSMVKGLVIYSKNFTTGVMRDGFNHGTGVASVTASLVPKCGILNMKVLNDDGEGTVEEVVLAIEDCLELREAGDVAAPMVMNLSLGTIDDGNYYNPLRIACRAAVEDGMYVYAAAGNLGPGPQSILNPACERYVGAVGSVSYEPFVISDFSSRGPTVEGLVKPEGVMFGEDIVLASSDSDNASLAKSGTSFSVAFVTALAVIYAEGVNRKAIAKYQLVELPPGELYYVPQEEIIDTYARNQRE